MDPNKRVCRYKWILLDAGLGLIELKLTVVPSSPLEP